MMDQAANILHADLDAFYASVEQLLNPALRGKPIAVGGGVVLAASYEAKAFGIRGGMVGRKARELCPQLVFVGGHFEDYQRLGDAAIAIIGDFTPLVVQTDPDKATGLPVVGAAAVKALFGGEQDVWLASCGGFYNSPFGSEGEACPSPFWGCLECSNAVVTARKVPALLAFLNFIRAQRQVLSEADWIAKFGRVHGRIAEQILPRFADAEIEEARRIGSSDPALLYLPPEARAP